MIHVNKNPGQKDQDDNDPTLLKKSKSHGNGNQEMDPVMDEESKHLTRAIGRFANNPLPESLH